MTNQNQSAHGPLSPTPPSTTRYPSPQPGRPRRRAPHPTRDHVLARARVPARARVLAVLLLTATAWLATPAVVASADDTLTWSVEPAGTEAAPDRANFAYAAEPGEVVTDALVVTNYGAAPLTLQVYAADAFTTSSGQLDLLPAGTASSDVGAWVEVGAHELTLDPGASQEVPFTLTVPADATPGDHAGGVVTSYLSTQAGSTVSLDRRLGARIHVRVGGDLLPALDVSDVSVDYADAWNPFAPSTATVRFTVTNTGNARMTATEVVGVEGLLGGSTASAPLTDLPELLPGDSVQREIAVTGVWPLVRADAQIELLPVAVGIGGSTISPVTHGASTWAVPWALLAALVLVVGGGVGGARLAAGRRAPDAAHQPRSAGESSR